MHARRGGMQQNNTGPGTLIHSTVSFIAAEYGL